MGDDRRGRMSTTRRDARRSDAVEPARRTPAREGWATRTAGRRLRGASRGNARTGAPPRRRLAVVSRVREVWINSCVFAPRERPGRPRDGHAPSASWLLSWIWRSHAPPAHPRSGRNAGKSPAGSFSSVLVEGWRLGLSPVGLFFANAHGCAVRTCRLRPTVPTKNRVRLGASAQPRLA